MSENVGLFSGGKDSLTACHSLWKKGLLKEVLYCRTGVGLNEEYVVEMCKKFNWKLNIVEPKEGETYEDFVRKFSFPHQGAHNAVMGYLKWHPMRKWYMIQKKAGRDITFISGRRKKESARRKRMKSNVEYSKTEGMKFWASIYNWETVDVWDYLKKHNLQRSPIYDTMHMSGDCLCGAFSTRGESHWLQVFHPELAERFRLLEEKYRGRKGHNMNSSKWGNQISLSDMKNQTNLDDLICQECVVPE